MARLKDLYQKKIILQLKDELGIDNTMAIPRIEKITLNMGVGEAVKDKKAMIYAVSDLEKISGQKPIITLSRKSISGFKIRNGWPIGVKVTLRGVRMYEFLDRLITLAIPRVRDFQGLSPKSFDGGGNYNLGFREQYIFPEVNVDKSDATRGMNISFVTNTKSDKEAFELLTVLGMPFAKQKAKLN